MSPTEHLVYHFTSIENLPSILERGVVSCDSTVQARGLLKVEAGDPDVKARRRMVTVPVPPRGSPADYVPFYFATRSPMLLKLKSGQVPTYSSGQRPLIYLVSTAERIASAGLRWVYSDGNCASSITAFYTDLTVIDEVVDWAVMRGRMWNDTADDPDRMRRRMAEFLVHGEVPWSSFLGIAVFDDAMATEARGMLDGRGQPARVAVRRDWYY